MKRTVRLMDITYSEFHNMDDDNLRETYELHFGAEGILIGCDMESGLCEVLFGNEIVKVSDEYIRENETKIYILDIGTDKSAIAFEDYEAAKRYGEELGFGYEVHEVELA